MKKNVNELGVFWQKCDELEDGDAAAPSSTFHSRITVAMTSNKQKHILELFSRSIVKISKIILTMNSLLKRRKTRTSTTTTTE